MINFLWIVFYFPLGFRIFYIRKNPIEWLNLFGEELLWLLQQESYSWREYECWDGSFFITSYIGWVLWEMDLLDQNRLWVCINVCASKWKPNWWVQITKGTKTWWFAGSFFFLFLVVAKGLSDLMTEAVKKGFYLGVKLGKRLRV